jgi:hypothetical protein
MFTFPVGFFNFVASGGGATDPFAANVVLFLKGDGTNGSTNIVDSSPSPKTISVFGNAQISTAQSKYGGSSIYLNGSSWLEIAHDSSLNFFASDFTIELWVRVANNNQSVIIEKRSTGFTTGDWIFWQRDVASYDIDNVGNGILTATPPTIDLWVHFVLQRRDNLYSKYIDGTLVVSGNFTQTIQNSTQPITIGRDRVGGGRFYLTGYIDSLRITSAARYTTNFNPETDTYLDIQDPISNLQLLLDGEQASIVDSSGKNRTVNNLGSGVTLDSSIKYAGNKSLRFNGSSFLDCTGSYLDFGLSDYEIDFQLYLDNGAATYQILDMRPPSTTGMYMDLYCQNRTLVFDENGVGVITSGSILLDATWTNINIKRVSSVVTLKVNNITIGSVNSITYANSARLLIGGNAFVSTVSPVGNIDDFSIKF